MDPSEEYAHRLAHWQSQLSDLQRRFVWIGNVRLGVALFAAVLAWLAFKLDIVSGWSLLIPLAAFIALVIFHERVARKQTFSERAAKLYRTGLDRLSDR